MPITIFCLDVKENGHEIPTVYKKNFYDIRIWLISYFVGLGRDEEEIPCDTVDFLRYCSNFKSDEIHIRIVQLDTSARPGDPVYQTRVL